MKAFTDLLCPNLDLLDNCDLVVLPRSEPDTTHSNSRAEDSRLVWL